MKYHELIHKVSRFPCYNKFLLRQCTVIYCTLGWSVEFFFVQTEQVNSSKVRQDFRSPNPKFRRMRCAPAHARQIFHFQKIPGGLNINFFLKIGIKLPFLIMYKRRKTNFKTILFFISKFKNAYFWGSPNFFNNFFFLSFSF